VLSGSITRIAESGNPRQAGTLQLAFSTLTIGSQSYPVQVTVTSLATHLDKAGVTTEDAAKVAAGAAVGGIAGRVIGGNRTGTLIGAGAGAVAGTVYATQTRDRDIVLASGATIVAVLADPFTRSVTTRN
jgi:outer membrane lipoprotein SlyB